MYFSEKFTKKLFRLGILLVIVLILLDLLTFFFYPDTKIGGIFLSTREQTPLTWVSSVILLIIALSCASKYMESNNTHMYLLSIVFLFFSMDDATYFHERFSSAIQELLPFLKEFPSYSWVVLYFPLLIYGVTMLVYFLWDRPWTKNKKLIIAVVLMGIALALDMLDGWIGKDGTLVYCLNEYCDLVVTHMFRLTEEIMEIFGLGIFAFLSIKKFSSISHIDGGLYK